MIRVSIVGASGYVGGELLRLLLAHPMVELVAATSERRAGQPLPSLHPHLRGHTDLRFSSAQDLQEVDLLFLALPHGVAAGSIERYAGLAQRIVDCSADFRLKDAADYERWYGAQHPAPQWLERFVYGLAEVNRNELREAHYISGVGCNATASNLALLPLVRAGVLDPERPVVVDLKVGSSEGGREAKGSSHHPERAGIVRPFAPVGHRHTAEVMQVTGLRDVHLSVTSVELVRGVAAAAHAWLKEPMQDREMWALWRESYASEPFVRIVHQRAGAYRHPEPRLVTGTNHADVGWALDADGKRIVALSAIDNLTKGAAGSAVQCMNLALGFEETMGLGVIGLHPA